MTMVLLFCIAEEAKPFVRKALDVTNDEGGGRNNIFGLVESRVCPSNKKDFKRELKDDETFETDFIGASEQDCQEWSLEKSGQVNFIEFDIIAIADARSARDDTLLIQYYNREFLDPDEDLEPEVIDFYPKPRNTWFDYRVNYEEADEVYICLKYVAPDCIFPTYFGRKEELTDEHGIFNVARAKPLVRGEDPDAPQA